MTKIEKQVLEKVNPSREYRKKLNNVIQEIEEILKQQIKEKKLPITIELVGSTAKDTYLQDNLDIDFFLLFPTRFPKEKIAKVALSVGRSFLNDTEESYAEHPYLRGYYKKHYVEIVPCYKIENVSHKLSAVDRTPLHTKFIKENLSESQKSEVRLFKQFLKGIGCYGAEAEVEGFSGYLCEILIIRFESFTNLIKNAQNWKSGEYLKLKKEKSPEFETPLTFIDPVDRERNVASALSKETFDLFIKACKEYLKKQSITFFFPNEIKPWSIDRIKSEILKQKCQYIGIRIEKPDIIVENLFPQVRKAVRSIWESCERNDFTVFDIKFHIDNNENNIYIILKTKDELLSETKIHMGPPVKMKKNAKDFMNKWGDHPRVTKKPYEKNGRLFVELRREHKDIKDFLEGHIKKFSLGKHIDKIVKKKYDLLDLNGLLTDNLNEFWTEYFDGKMIWER